MKKNTGHITPPFLKLGDNIGITAPARKITEAALEYAIRVIKKRGYNIVLGENIYGSSNQFAGNDEQRTDDFQKMIDDDNIKAIFCARGGYGSVRIIDKLNFEKFRQKPKWIVGFSDITVFHSHIHKNFAIESLHAPMPVNFNLDGLAAGIEDLVFQILSGHLPEYKFGTHLLNRSGQAKGLLTGGNLSVLYSLLGSASDIDTDNKILFIEDLDEYLYHIDRMVQCLKRAGKLEKLSALIIGGMTKMNDNTIPFGQNAFEIIAEAVKEYRYPVCYDFPAGHIKNNNPLILGREATLEVYSKAENRLFF